MKKISPETRQAILDWKAARLKLGTTKELAHRLGISESKIDVVVAEAKAERYFSQKKG